MTAAAILLAVLEFAAWEAALFAASIWLARRIRWESAAEEWLAILAIEVTLESSAAALFSFAGLNSRPAYWIVAAVCAIALVGMRRPAKLTAVSHRLALAGMAAATAPLILLSFRPVEEIDSINYLHYLIDWMANRATPYVFATNYVAFWELSFLPAWTVTRVDFFFPLVALKALVLVGLAAWLIGRELGVPDRLLAATVFGSLLMRHYWYEYSGVPTLKNDALHGAGFLLLALVMIRAARRRPEISDLALLALGAAFASVKYTGIFFAAIAGAIVLVRARRIAAALAVAAVWLLTSGHYYLHNLVRWGSPFYPFQINLGPIHLPGTADLSYTSILFNLRDARAWGYLFAPEAGVSPAGLLFPAILGGTLMAATWLTIHGAWRWLRTRRPPLAVEWAAFALLCGWLLYFRSVYSASAGHGDLAFLRNSLNSVRYVDGVLAMSEVFLVSLIARFPFPALMLVLANAVSRLVILYARENVPPLALIAAAALALCLFALPGRRVLAAAAVCLLLGTPFLVELNRAQWTTYWNPLKPTLARLPADRLASLTAPDGGYYAGHVVAAGNPVRRAVRSLTLDELPAARPRYVALLVTPGSEAGAAWRTRYAPSLTALGYRLTLECPAGALFEQPPIR